MVVYVDRYHTRSCAMLIGFQGCTQAVSWALETGMLLTLNGDLKPV